MDYTPTNHHNQPSHETINIYAYTRARGMVFQSVFMFSGISRTHFSKKRGTSLDSCLLFTAIHLALPPHSCHSPQHFSLTAITEDKHITTKQQKKGVSKVFLTRPWLSFFSIDYSWRLRTATASPSISHSGRHTRASTIRQGRSG